MEQLYRFVKASERLPESYSNVIWRYPDSLLSIKAEYVSYAFKKPLPEQYTEWEWLEPIPKSSEGAVEENCAKCGRPIGNPVFTVCDNCWESKPIEEKSDVTGLIEHMKKGRDLLASNMAAYPKTKTSDVIAIIDSYIKELEQSQPAKIDEQDELWDEVANILKRTWTVGVLKERLKYQYTITKKPTGG